MASIGLLNHHATPTCPEAQPVPLLAVVGRTDHTYSIEEGLVADLPHADPPGPLVEEAGDWAATDDCLDEPTELRQRGGIVHQEYDC